MCYILGWSGVGLLAIKESLVTDQYHDGKFHPIIIMLCYEYYEGFDRCCAVMLYSMWPVSYILG